VEKVVYEAHVEYGYTLKEIAEHLGVLYTMVGRIIRRVGGKVILQDLTPL